MHKINFSASIFLTYDCSPTCSGYVCMMTDLASDGCFSKWLNIATSTCHAASHDESNVNDRLTQPTTCEHVVLCFHYGDGYGHYTNHPSSSQWSLTHTFSVPRGKWATTNENPAPVHPLSPDVVKSYYNLPPPMCLNDASPCRAVKAFAKQVCLFEPLLRSISCRLHACSLWSFCLPAKAQAASNFASDKCRRGGNSMVTN